MSDSRRHVSASASMPAQNAPLRRQHSTRQVVQLNDIYFEGQARKLGFRLPLFLNKSLWKRRYIALYINRIVYYDKNPREGGFPRGVVKFSTSTYATKVSPGDPIPVSALDTGFAFVAKGGALTSYPGESRPLSHHYPYMIAIHNCVFESRDGIMGPRTYVIGWKDPDHGPLNVSDMLHYINSWYPCTQSTSTTARLLRKLVPSVHYTSKDAASGDDGAEGCSVEVRGFQGKKEEIRTSGGRTLLKSKSLRKLNLASPTAALSSFRAPFTGGGSVRSRARTGGDPDATTARETPSAPDSSSRQVGATADPAVDYEKPTAALVPRLRLSEFAIASASANAAARATIGGPSSASTSQLVGGKQRLLQEKAQARAAAAGPRDQPPAPFVSQSALTLPSTTSKGNRSRRGTSGASTASSASLVSFGPSPAQSPRNSARDPASQNAPLRAAVSCSMGPVKGPVSPHGSAAGASRVSGLRELVGKRHSSSGADSAASSIAFATHSPPTTAGSASGLSPSTSGSDSDVDFSFDFAEAAGAGRQRASAVSMHRRGFSMPGAQMEELIMMLPRASIQAMGDRRISQLRPKASRREPTPPGAALPPSSSS